MNGPEAIQGVTFDVGGTLIEPWPSVGRVYAEVAGRHGWGDIPAEVLDARFADAWRATPAFDYTRAGWEEMVNRTFQGLNPAAARVPFFTELYERFAEPGAWRVFDDVRPALDALASRGLRLGIVSNWDERLRVLLQRLRLHTCFETMVISCEVGFPKPSPAIFAHAAVKLGLPPPAILHVGDSLELDVRGARAAGFRALRLARGGGELRDDEVPSLAGLPARIGGGN